MRVSVIQMSPGADKAANIAAAGRLLAQAVAADRPALVALPEIWTCLGGDRDAKFAAAEVLPAPGEGAAPGSAYAFLRDFAVAENIHVHGGSIGERAGNLLFNTSLVFAPYGAGEAVVACDVAGTRLGLAICYDLRFAELFLALRRAGAELIVLPAAFTLQTGMDHWETLIRARAIETQCWLAAPACTGRHRDAGGAARFTYGHSLIANPWGHVGAQASDGPGWASAAIDKAMLARIRADMPVLQHRRLA